MNFSNLYLGLANCNLLKRNLQKNLSQNLTDKTTINYIKYALAKSKAERGNSNFTKADNNTPLSACFFMRKSHTPKIDLFCDRLCSMVACGGQRLIVGCIPLYAVFHPVARYRPKAWKLLAVALKKQTKETAEMIYQFLGISRQHYDQTKAEQIRILADNETQARAYLARDYVLISLGRLPNTAKNDRTLTVKGGIYA
ncbi:host cell division inhibitor Icd-like protein [Bisgaard Taxon 45]